jgi:hypothetical protein
MFNLSSGGGHLGFPIDKKKQKLFYPYHGKISSYMQLQRRRFQKFMQIRKHNWSHQLCWIYERNKNHVKCLGIPKLHLVYQAWFQFCQ